MTEAEVRGRVRKVLEGVDASSPDTDQQITLTLQQELEVAQGAAPYCEIVRGGRAFYVAATAAVAAVVALPTTAVLLALYNGEPDGGRGLVIDWVSATCGATVSGATATGGEQAQLLAGVGQPREAVPADSGLVLKKCNGYGGSGVDTRARTVINTTVPTAPTWFPIGAPGIKFNVVANTSSVGYGCYAEANGRFWVPPGRYFCVSVIADSTSETFISAIGWHEVQTQLG